jgi:hypothetical protein
VFGRTSSDADFRAFKTLRNRVKSLCRNAKLRFFHDQFNRNNPSSILWHNVRRLGVRPLVTEPFSVSSEDLNLFFTTELNTVPSSFPDRSLPISQFNHTLPEEQFFFSYVEPSEISHTILSINKKCKGVDDIPIIFYKKLLPIILPTLTHLFNFSLQSAVFPDLWKQSIIIPIPKKRNPSVPSDYRPISILCSLSKALEKIVHKQITSYLNRFDFFVKYQSGFRINHSTNTALLKVTDDIRAAMDRRMLTILVQFDFSKAFDNVSHSVLLYKLKHHCNFSYSAVSWFTSYLSGRCQAVICDSSISSWRPKAQGVPQGSVLGPLLFSIFINNAPLMLSHNNYHLFADDLIIYSHFSICNTMSTINNTNVDVSSLMRWAAVHGLSINPSKTKSIIIGNPKLRGLLDVGNLPVISVCGSSIEYSKCVRILGVLIDDRLNWNDHVTNVSNKVFAGMHQLKRVKKFLPQSVKAVLISSLILPLFDYCCLVYCDITDELNYKLQKALNYAIRFIFDANRYDHVTPFYNELGWLKLRDRRRYFLLVLVFKLIVKREGPAYLCERLTLLSDIHPGRNTRSHPYTLQVPLHRTAIFNSSFCTLACRLWNTLPYELLNSSSVISFKNRIYKYILNNNLV